MKELYFDRLLPALGIPEYVRCICAAGAGGKTGLLGRLAAEYRDMGKHVLLTTTTKMYLPEAYGALDCSAGEILDRLDRDGFVIAGSTVCEGEKMGPLPKEVWDRVVPEAEIVLVEADGSRRLPLKVPGVNEPVIPGACDFLIVVEGMSGIGRPLLEVCHRTKQAAALLGCPEKRKVTVKMTVRIAREGYQSLLKRENDGEGKGSCGCYFLNQADCLDPEQRAEIAAAMDGTETVIGSLKEGFFLRYQ